MTLPKCKMKLPGGDVVEGSICGYIETAAGRCVLFWHSRETWGVFPEGRIIPNQLTLFE